MRNKQNVKVGDRVTVTDGSSDGHRIHTVPIMLTFPRIRIKRDADGVEVDVASYHIHEENNVGTK